MKKLLGSVLALTMLFGALTGCGGSGDSGTAGDSGAAKSGDSGEFKIGLSMSARDQFLSSIETAVKDSAKEMGAVVETFDAENDQQKQMSHVQTAVSNKFDAIIINLVNTDDAPDLIKAAGDIPVVFVNRAPHDELLAKGKVMYVGSDEKVAGELQGKFLAELLKKEGKKEINYVLFMGILGLQNTTVRTESAIKALEDSGLTVHEAFKDTAEWDRVKAMEKMQAFLGSAKPFDVVISNNDEMALGAIEAIKAAKMEMVPVVGIDATSNALLAIEKGDMSASVFQDAVGQGKGALETAIKLAKGEAGDDTTVWIPFQLVTKENIADFK